MNLKCFIGIHDIKKDPKEKNYYGNWGTCRRCGTEFFLKGGEWIRAGTRFYPVGYNPLPRIQIIPPQISSDRLATSRSKR